jgi:bifunctional non-homologous end joining protein LigD
MGVQTMTNSDESREAGPTGGAASDGARRPADNADLADYRAKRHFERTAEPSGSEAAGPAAEGGPAADPNAADAPPRRVFVVQKHDASRLHYDFRLELNGVLKSWAVPKGPSLDPADKRLAVMVEDHPLEYAAFEGGIPKGEYGGGTVMVWDTGWWEPDETWGKEGKGAQKAEPPLSPEEALAKGELKLVIHGKKLGGSWALVKTKWRGENNWLLIKHRDEAAREGSDIEQEAPDSAATGRSLEEIAAQGRT